MLFLCIKVFLVRILDVSLGTVRTMFTVKGNKLVASLIGFFEILIWFLIVKEALQTTNDSILIAISYSLGFATGTYIGSSLSDYLITGKIAIEVFTTDIKLESTLRDKGYAVTVAECVGYSSTIKRMLYILIDKKKEKGLRELVKTLDKSAFIVEADTKYVENGYFK